MRGVAARAEAVGPAGDAGLREAELVGVGDPAGGHDHALGLDAVLAVGAGDDECAALQALRGGLEAQVDPPRAQAPQHRCGERLLDGRQDAVERLDDGDAGAELGQRGAELEPDVAGAHDRDALGDGGQGQGAGRVQHPLAVEGQPRQGDGA